MRPVYITRNFTTGRVLFQLTGLPGAAFAMYRCAKPEKPQESGGTAHSGRVHTGNGRNLRADRVYLLVRSAGTLLAGICALCGLCYVVAEITQVSINGNALLFMIPNLFQPP